MNVLIVVDRYYPKHGGIEQYIRGLARQLTHAGHRITILTRVLEGCPLKDEWEEGIILRTPVLDNTVAEPWVVLDRWRQMVPLIQDIQPDVVYANNHSSVATIKACRHLDLPVVYGCHGWGLLCALKFRLMRPDQSLCYNQRSRKNCMNCFRMNESPPRITGIRSARNRIKWEFQIQKKIAAKVALYDHFQDILESADARVGVSNLTAGLFRTAPTFGIHLGLDSTSFQPVPSDTFRNAYGIKGPYLLVTSRIHNTKGQDWAIRSLLHLPNEVKLVLAGNSSLLPDQKHEESIHTLRARKIIEESGLADRIVFTGFLNNEELVQAYSGAAATIVPSVWLEPFGYVTAEAMACASAVVVTENCGSAELVTNGKDGYVIPRMNPAAIAEAVKKILPRQKEMGNMARNTVLRELSWEKIAGKILSVFEGAMH
jgi:glycosyltransferase involved in cell wall biosynthesis